MKYGKLMSRQSYRAFEVQRIADSAHVGLTSINRDEVREAALDVLRYLPARSAGVCTLDKSTHEGVQWRHTFGSC